MKYPYVIASLLACISLPVSAFAEDQPLKFFVGGGATVGQESDVQAVGSKTTIGQLKMAGAETYAGIEYRWSDRIYLVNSLGYHAGTVNFAGSTARLTGVIFDGVILYGITDRIRVGGGVEVAAHQALAAGPNNLRYEYKTAPGLAVQAEYLFTPHFGMALRATSATYKSKDGASSFDARNVGVLVNYRF